MTFVRTIRGDIAPEEMGTTNAHDHLIRSGGGEVMHDPDHLLDSVDKAVEEAARFLGAGGTTIVDMCPVDCGRDIEKLLAVNERLPDLNIIVATGFHQAKNYEDTRTHWVTRYTVDQITELRGGRRGRGDRLPRLLGPDRRALRREGRGDQDRHRLRKDHGV
jgi:predicted metal-dependent phosphotriesterase family hydrolase